MISIFGAYKSGLSQAWKQKVLLLYLYGINFLFAYIVALPVSMMLSKALDNTTASDRLLEAFDFSIFTTIVSEYGRGISLSRILITFGLFYLILNVFLSGGILSLLVQDTRFKFSKFLLDCSLYFKRFLKLLIISGAFFLLMLLLFILISKVSGYFTEDAATEHLVFTLLVIRLVILGIMFASIVMIFDYAKIMTVANDLHRMLETLKAAVIFIYQSLIKTAGLFKLYLFTSAAVLVFYWAIGNVMTISNGWMVLLFFIWAQLCMFLKLWVRLGFFAGQYAFYRHAASAISGARQAIPDETTTGSAISPQQENM